MTNSFYKKLIAYIFSGLAIFIFAALFFVYSQLKDLDNIKNMVVEKIEKMTGRNVSIGEAELKFEKGISIRLKQLSVYSSNGKNLEFSAKNAWCVIKLWPLLNKRIKVKKFILEGAHIELVRDEQGKFNFGDPFFLLPEQSSSRLFKLIGAGFMHQMSVSDSEVRFQDHYKISGPEPYLTSINNINLTINKRFFQNIFSFNLSGKIPDEHLTTEFYFSGGIGGFEKVKENQPIPFQGKVRVDQLRFVKLRPYLRNVLSAVHDETKLSLESDISGSLRGVLRAKGKLKFLGVAMGQKPVLKNVSSPNEGEVDYSLELDKGSLEVQNIKIRSGQSNFSGRGKLIGYNTKAPGLSFPVKTNEFKIGETRNNFSLMIFPETFHKKINQFFDNGTLEIESLHYDGSLKQLQNLDSKKSKNRITAKIGFKKTDWHSPLPPLEKVTGFFEYKGGDGFIEIVNARFENLPMDSIKGTVKDVMNNPLADLSIESKLDLGRLNNALKKSITGQSFEKILDDYQEVEGSGLLEAKLQGPLEELDKI